MSPKVTPVVAAVAARDGRFLITQRMPGKQFADMWEFPGGKVEEGETLQQALERELMEELGVTARIGDVQHVCMHAGYMILFLSAEVEGEMRFLEVQDARFVTPDEAREMNMTPQDRQAMEHMLSAGRLI